MRARIHIGIIGDYNRDNPTHVATDQGIRDAAESLHVQSLNTVWLATDQVHRFSDYQGLLCSPGSPYNSLEGALLGIQCAREKEIPFLGTCGGSQHLVLEYARNVMGIREAGHAESDPCSPCLFITPLSCSLVGKTMEVNVKSGSRAAQIYGATQAVERYYCNFGLNPAYRERLERAGLAISGTDSLGEARIMELPEHPFFLGTLFVPQASSTREAPHPILMNWLRAASEHT
jgi:CTP synthase (UTP-ammonia lyase)